MGDTSVQRAFGRRVRELRKARGLSQEALAERVGRTADTISNIERGSAATRLSTALELAAVFGVSLGDLFADPREAQPAALKRARSKRIAELHQLLDAMDDAGLAAIYEVVKRMSDPDPV